MRNKILLISMFLSLLYSPESYAWGAKGHRLITEIAIKDLSKEIPYFISTPENMGYLMELSREPDRSRGAGLSHDKNLDPAHFIDIDNEGYIAGVVNINNPLPQNREAYDELLRKNNSNEYLMGYLPYAMLDGWQQLRKDFAYWKVDDVGERESSNLEMKQWFQEDKKLRELIIIRDLGYWSHFIEDSSQPLHATIHYNGWVSQENLNQFSRSKKIHSQFETVFVDKYIELDMIQKNLKSINLQDCKFENYLQEFLVESYNNVNQLYTIEREQGFEKLTKVNQKFVVEQLARGTSFLRDSILSAWACSGDISVGYPEIPVKKFHEQLTESYKNLKGY